MVQAVRVVNQARECAATYGDTYEVRLMEAADKFRTTRIESREYRFFGAVVNQLRDPPPEKVIERMERKDEKKRSVQRLGVRDFQRGRK